MLPRRLRLFEPRVPPQKLNFIVHQLNYRGHHHQKCGHQQQRCHPSIYSAHCGRYEDKRCQHQAVETSTEKNRKKRSRRTHSRGAKDTICSILILNTEVGNLRPAASHHGPWRSAHRCRSSTESPTRPTHLEKDGNDHVEQQNDSEDLVNHDDHGSDRRLGSEYLGVEVLTLA